MQLDVFARPGSDRMVALRSLLPLVSEQSATTWIQIAMEGSWDGHPTGSFKFDRDVFGALVRNFNAQKNPIPLTYEHPQYAGDGKPIPAAGWIHDLDVRRGPDGVELWAKVEFTKRGAEFVREGEYRYCSVVVAFESTDRKTGEESGPELYEVGLTNVPFIDGMKPIRLSRAGHGASNKRNAIAMSVADIIKQALKDLGPDADIDQFIAYVKAEQSKQEAIEGKGAESPAEDAPEDPASEMSAAKPDDAVSASVEPSETVTELADAPPAGTPEDVAAATDTSAAAVVDQIAQAMGTDAAGAIAALQDNMDAILSVLSGAPESGTPADDPSVAGMARDAYKAREAAMSKQVADREKTITSLNGRIAKLEDEALCRKIDDAIKAGHILDADREKMVKLGRRDADLLDEFLGSAKADPAVPSAPYKMSRPSDGADVSAVSDYDRESPEYKAFEVQLRHAVSDPAKRHEIIVNKLNARAERVAH